MLCNLKTNNTTIKNKFKSVVQVYYKLGSKIQDTILNHTKIPKIYKIPNAPRCPIYDFEAPKLSSTLTENKRILEKEM